MRTQRALLLGGVVIVGVMGIGATARAQLLVHSHDDFSGVQGEHGWFYGFFDGSSDTPWSLDDFELLPNFDGMLWTRTTGPGGYWTNVNRDGGHPNGMTGGGGRIAENNWSVRRWVADGDYVLQLSGRLWDTDTFPDQGNGVIGRIMVDGATIWERTIEAGNIHGIDYLLNVCTTVGTVIDFAIDPRDGNDFSDSTGFWADIRTIIERQPQDAFTCAGGTAFFSVVALPGVTQYRWRHNGEILIHDADGPTLVVANVTPDKVGLYDCVVWNSCGSMVSDAAALTICDADFDCDGQLDSRDFFTFLDSFFAMDPRADINKDESINSQDFFAFLIQFFHGCPTT